MLPIVPDSKATIRFPSMYAVECFLAKLKGSGLKVPSSAQGLHYRIESDPNRPMRVALSKFGKVIEMKIRDERGWIFSDSDWKAISEWGKRYCA